MTYYQSKVKKVLTLLFAFAMMTFVLTIVPGRATVAAPSKYVKSLKVSKSKFTLTSGDKETIKATVKVAGSASKKVKVSLSKSDKKEVSVKVGKPNKKGVTKVTITAKKVSKKQNAKVKITTSSKNKKKKKITKTITVTVKPKEATTEKSTTEKATTEQSTEPTTAEDPTTEATTERTTEDTTIETPTGELDDKLVVWTTAIDMENFGQKYQEATGVEVETIVISPQDFPMKVETALLSKETEPDIITVEPQQLEEYYEKGFFADLDQFGAKDYDGKIVDYVWQKGKDANGVQRTISYQITPAGIYYRRDIAKEVFGTDDPEEIGKLFADYGSIYEAAVTLKENGYRIFGSEYEMSYFSGDSAWVIDGKLNLAPERIDYMELMANLYQQDLTSYAVQWSSPWYIGMAGEVPLLTADTQWGADTINIWDLNSFLEATADFEKTQIFAYSLPTWGAITMLPHTMGTTYGNWGICAGPSNGFGGGNYLGISSYSERKGTAWDFIKFCTLTESTAEWWLEETTYDMVSLISVMEKHKDDTFEAYGGQKLYDFWLKQAQKIDLSVVSSYASTIGDAWGSAIGWYKNGYITKEEAIRQFYDKVEESCPNIEVER